VSPIYYVLFTSFAMIATGILYDEFTNLSVTDSIGLAVGFSVIVVGVVLLNLFKDFQINLEDVKYVFGPQPKPSSRLAERFSSSAPSSLAAEMGVLRRPRPMTTELGEDDADAEKVPLIPKQRTGYRISCTSDEVDAHVDPYFGGHLMSGVAAQKIGHSSAERIRKREEKMRQKEAKKKEKEDEKREKQASLKTGDESDSVRLVTEATIEADDEMDMFLSPSFVQKNKEVRGEEALLAKKQEKLRRQEQMKKAKEIEKKAKEGFKEKRANANDEGDSLSTAIAMDRGLALAQKENTIHVEKQANDETDMMALGAKELGVTLALAGAANRDQREKVRKNAPPPPPERPPNPVRSAGEVQQAKVEDEADMMGLESREIAKTIVEANIASKLAKSKAEETKKETFASPYADEHIEKVEKNANVVEVDAAGGEDELVGEDNPLRRAREDVIQAFDQAATLVKARKKGRDDKGSDSDASFRSAND